MPLFRISAYHIPWAQSINHAKDRTWQVSTHKSNKIRSKGNAIYTKEIHSPRGTDERLKDGKLIITLSWRFER